MYRIPLKSKELTYIKDNEGKPLILEWAATLKDICQFTKDGFGPAEMRTAIKILDKLEIHENELNLTTEEYNFLKSRLDLGFKFRIVDKTILEFVEDIENAKDE